MFKLYTHLSCERHTLKRWRKNDFNFQRAPNIEKNHRVHSAIRHTSLIPPLKTAQGTTELTMSAYLKERSVFNCACASSAFRSAANQLIELIASDLTILIIFGVGKPNVYHTNNKF